MREMSADAPSQNLAKKESIVARILPVFAGLVLFGLGCSPQASFQSETLEIGQDKLIVKGWTKGEKFCVEIRLDSKQRALGLHSVKLVSPDGKEYPPDKWKDQTPKPPSVGLSLGMGFGLGGGRHRDPHAETDRPRGGRSSSIVPSVGFPLKLGKDSKAVTAIEACWKVSKDKGTSPATGCTLEVNLVIVQKDKIEVTTVLLTMMVHQDEEDTSTEQEQDEKSVKDIVREIDFTLKEPAKTKTLAT